MEIRGDPISYLTLENGTAILDRFGYPVGEVGRVLLLDGGGFDGIIVRTASGRFVDAPEVRRISADAVTLGIRRRSPKQGKSLDSGWPLLTEQPASTNWTKRSRVFQKPRKRTHTAPGKLPCFTGPLARVLAPSSRDTSARTCACARYPLVADPASSPEEGPLEPRASPRLTPQTPLIMDRSVVRFHPELCGWRAV